MPATSIYLPTLTSAYLPKNIEYYPVDTVDHYLWVVIVAFFAAFMAAFGIGANDVANAFATSVGSKALTVKQACCIAVVMEFVGACFMGGEVVKTIRGSLANINDFKDNPPLLMWGCMCVDIATAVWLILATRFEMPVSTTHSCVGGMVGMTIALRGANSVIWFKEADATSPIPGGFLSIVVSWFLSPLLSAITAGILFSIVRLILRTKNSFENSVRTYPIMVFFCVMIVSVYMLTKGITSKSANLDKLEDDQKFGIACAIAAVCAAVSIPPTIYMRHRIVTGKFTAPPLAIEVALEQRAAAGRPEFKLEYEKKHAEAIKREYLALHKENKIETRSAETTTTDDAEAGTAKGAAELESMDSRRELESMAKSTEGNAVEAIEETKVREYYRRVTASVMSSLNQDIHGAVIDDERTFQVHMKAERFDKRSEAMFTYLQVFSACFDALAHGANDVANAVGPLSTVFLLYNGEKLGSNLDMGEWRFMILGFGGAGICLGLLLYGSQILRALGVKLAVVTPARGFCIEMGSASIVILGSYYGIPLSTTHCQVGATTGVGLLEGYKGINWWILGKSFAGWLITCVFVAFVTGILAGIGAFAPSARYPEVQFFNCSTSSRC
ncbi:phosphate permease [Chrysochromulina tobinii]|uniref:Phosphate transporter n=1 Tax=Chrysochromulina tobinii TaxID=1460289 RepID=A0A0M0K957_9EUKA|nr:phosphate permease [Chrysochromulina tobinii]|eukprot:KOO34928.1 phosphate permease [Chrysochromulina sp. CCMP291]